MNESSHSQNWLAFLLYGLDLLHNPKPYKYLQTFEPWGHKNRLRPQLYQLRRAKLLELRGQGIHRTWSLTPRGHLAACGGIELQQRWSRPWDGKWRWLMFDLPSRAQPQRTKLWRWLRSHRFGLIQHSVWLTPDAVDDTNLPLDRFKLSPHAALVVEGHPTAPVSDADLVLGAWDFDNINNRYRSVLQMMARGRQLAGRGDAEPSDFGRWLADERTAWLHAVDEDPLLPSALLPAGYLGRQAWSERQAVFSAIAKKAPQLNRKS